MNRLSQQGLPWIKVLLSQALVIGALWFLGDKIPVHGLLRLVLQGFVAAIIGRFMGLSWFWMPIQILLPLAVAFNAAVPAWAYLVAFVLCGLVYWNSASEQVPFYMTNRKTWQAISDLTGEANSFVDLGSGMGGVVAFVARAHPNLKAFGFETAPLVYLGSKIYMLFAASGNAKVIYKSIWHADLANYDVVYCFLSPVPMPRMFDKARAEMRAGTLLISNSFPVPNHEPDRIISVDDRRQTQLYVYVM
jgi:hypothetical protein